MHALLLQKVNYVSECGAALLSRSPPSLLVAYISF
jgi:hypothetical protein